jgi:hypothetical protein
MGFSYTSHNAKILLLLSWPRSWRITFMEKTHKTARNLLQKVCSDLYFSKIFIHICSVNSNIYFTPYYTVVHTSTLWYVPNCFQINHLVQLPIIIMQVSFLIISYYFKIPPCLLCHLFYSNI